ncbi:uncharacterized protein LOC125767390 [Anopheles funestus]|uniref:uncharacterized protein LOC125767390 n=1 Tax=Anopheles funestus TaxID=62324 RepID=UPI0020C656BC|nr:uncharacterized protein LOC125767390 [Anopheles funestus]
MPTSLVECTLFPCAMETPDDEKQQLPSPTSGDLPEGLVFVSSGSEGPDEDEDHEEGEIQDEDEEDAQHPQELEDISSEEESTIRERMAALEAMDKKVGMMKRKYANHSKYDYLDFEEVMNGKENYYYYPQHPNPLYRSHKPYKPSATNKEDNRYSVGKHARTVATKRSADKAKEKSSKRSSHRRHKRRRYASRSPTPSERRALSTDSEPETVVDREYLKIACGIGNGKNQRLSSSRNPLKKKLFLQTSKRKRKAEGKHKPVVEMLQSASSSNSDNDAIVVDEEDEEEEEEEEELQLRLLALSTKPIVREAGLSDIISEFQIPSPPPPPTINLAEDNMSDAVSAEEHELRLIALKTAVLKKHESRKKRKELDNEQPYSPSDDIVLSPVREIAPLFDNELYSDGRDSVEMIEDDDVQIVEPHYEQIDLVDSDDNGNDMEISPLGSPIGRVDTEHDMEENSHQPIDMDLASSDSISSAPSPAYSGTAMEQRLLLAGTDSCDSTLFHRRGEILQESPSATPDSMEEAEAEALRHLLLTKMRQKQTKKKETVEPTQEKLPENDEQTSSLENETMDTAPNESIPVVQDEKELSPCEEEPNQESTTLGPTTNTSNVITVVDRKPQRKRRKKTLSSSASVPVVEAESTKPSSPATSLPSEPRPQLTKASSIVHTQKLVNNPNKLINLNRTAAPSPPTIVAGPRTDSPKELTMVETFVSRPVAKLVIQLGNSDSDSEVDFSTSSPEKGDKADDGSVSISVAITAGAPATTTVRFEEQLDKFLKSVRSKSTTLTTKDDGTKEQMEHSERAISSSEKSLPSTKQQQQQQLRNAAKKLPTSSNSMATPTAVRHLSKAAQMEYMRLVARKAQLERYKLARQNSAHSSSTVLKDNAVPKQDTRPANNGPAVEQKSLEPKHGKSPGRRKQSFTSASQPTTVAAESPSEEQATIQDPVERKLQQIRSSLPNLSEASRNRLLLTAEKHLEKHSGSFLSEMERHNATILEAQQARRELYHLENRIELLKEKLSLLENVYEKRRHRSFDTFSSLQTTRKKILFSRKRSGELERMCSQIGRFIKGESYQLPTSSKGAVVQQQLRILIAETQQLRMIRKPTLQEFKEEMIANHKRRLADAGDPAPSWKTSTYDNECDEGRSIEVANNREDETAAEPAEINPADSIIPGEEPCDPPSQTFSPVRDDESCTKEPLEQAVEVEVPSKDEANDEKSVEAAEPVVEQNTTQADAVAVETIEEEKEMLNVEVLPQEEKPVPCITPDLKPSEEDTMIEHEAIVPGETFRIEKYTSPLMSLKQGAQNIPTGILCPFELGGQCVDRDCKYEHFSQRTA